MARPQRIDIPQTLATLFRAKLLSQLAKQAGVLVRARKVQVQALFWTLVLGFGLGPHRTVAGLRRAYQMATGVVLAASSFYDRFTPALVRFLKKATAHALQQVAAPRRSLQGVLSSFADLVVTDSTVIRLHDLLKVAFPACRTNHTQAALKLHAVLNVTGAAMRSIKLTAERAHDGPVFSVGRWVKDRLLLFDLAYFRYQLFSCIDRNGGYFIARLKKNADPLIVGTNRRWRGKSVPLVGHPVREVVDRLQRQCLDVTVQVRFKRRTYGGVRHSGTARFRLVGVRDARSGDYHLYLTNIPPQRLSPEEIAQSYSARWLVELFFRQCKQHCRADQMPSGKREVVEALLYAALLTWLVTRALLCALCRCGGVSAGRVPQERWAALLGSVALELLRLVLHPTEATSRRTRDLLRMLLHEAVDPNVKRRQLLERVESCTQFEHLLSVGGAHA